MLFKDLQRCLVVQSLMRSLGIVVHFPQPMLVASVLGIDKALLGKAFFIVGAITALDDAIFPGAAFLDQGMDAPAGFDGFGKSGLAFGMGGVAHGEIHGVVGESYEKGGRLSSAR